jgi:DNA-binding MarR family transcriptional regulator
MRYDWREMGAADGPMPSDAERYQGLAGFRLALRQFVAASEAISKRAGVTQQQYQAMLAIRTWPTKTMTVKDLSEELLLTHHAAVQLVNRLERAGLVERRPSAVDRRSVLLRLSARGDGLTEGLAEQHLEEVLRQEPLLSRSLRQLRKMAGEAPTAAKAP